MSGTDLHRRCGALLLIALGLSACQGSVLAGQDGGADGSLSDATPGDASGPHDAAPDAGLLDGGGPDADPACQGIPAQGRCDGEVLSSCPEGAPVTRDCAADGLHCLEGAEGGRCDALPQGCQDLPPGGLCAGERLYLCHADWMRYVPCDELGGQCGLDGPRPGCQPGAGGPRQATGTITLDKRPYDGDGLGAPASAPAEGLTVVVRRAADDAPLNFGVTDALGRFTVPYDIGAGPDGVYLRVSAFNFTGSHRTWVTDGADHTYAFTSPAVDDAAGQPVIDLHVAEDDDGAALNIFGVLFRNTSSAAALTGALLPPLQALWERGQSLACGTCFWQGQITLLGTPEDTDEYDDTVISHEFGHYVAWAVSRDDTPGGFHDGTPTDPRLAWSEGLATWLGLVVLGESLYIDTKETGATVRDPDELGWDADPAGTLSQDLSEFVVLETLWDIVDPQDATDPVARPATDVVDVVTAYLPAPAMADRGAGGVDFVDFLDGWFCRGHGATAGLTTLVVDQQGFPYDFAGPAQPCPKPAEPMSATLRLLPGDPRAAGPTVELVVTDRLGAADATATLVLPDGYHVVGHTAATRPLGALEAHRPRRERWTLRGPRTPPWIGAGVTADRGRRGVDHHVARVTLRAPRRAPAPVRRVSLGGLLALRIRALR